MNDPISREDIDATLADLQGMWAALTDLCMTLPNAAAFLATRKELPPIIGAIFEQAALRSHVAAPDMTESGWTPEQALRFYAAGKHFDVVDGRTRILDTGAVASDALKGLSAEYAANKGVAASSTRATLTLWAPQCAERLRLSMLFIEEWSNWWSYALGVDDDAPMPQAEKDAAEKMAESLGARARDMVIDNRRFLAGTAASAIGVSERDRIIEECAALIEPEGNAPCGCLNPASYGGCDCRNTGDLQEEEAYWSSKNDAANIRALKSSAPTDGGAA